VLIPANTTEAAVSRIDQNCTGWGRVSIERIIFVSGWITSRYSPNLMNFPVGWAAANSPKEIPPRLHTYAKADEIRCSNRVLSATFLDLLYLQTLATAWADVLAFQRWTVLSG